MVCTCARIGEGRIKMFCFEMFLNFFFYILNKIEKLYVFYRETRTNSVISRGKGMDIYTNEDETLDENDETL